MTRPLSRFVRRRERGETAATPRMSTADPYRSDEVPASQYSDRGRRFSAEPSFNEAAGAAPRQGFFPWRTALAAAFLFSFGTTFLLLGTLHFKERDRGAFIAFVTIGSIAFLPGAYAGYNLFHAVRGTPGFHISECMFFVPLFFCFTLVFICGREERQERRRRWRLLRVRQAN
jgi:Transmembrane proteins 230/134